MLIANGILIPFWGTLLGSAFVFLLRGKMNKSVQRILLGIASGVMSAAAVWSLLIPAIESSSPMGKWAFIPAASGFLLGVITLILIDKVVINLQSNIKKNADDNKKKHTFQKVPCY